MGPAPTTTTAHVCNDMRWMLLLCIIMFIYALHSLLTSSFAAGTPVHHIVPSTYISWAMAAAYCMLLYTIPTVSTTVLLLLSTVILFLPTAGCCVDQI